MVCMPSVKRTDPKPTVSVRMVGPLTHEISLLVVWVCVFSVLLVAQTFNFQVHLEDEQKKAQTEIESNVISTVLFLCVDMDECDKIHGPSGLCGDKAVCTNKEGTFSCSCPPGYSGNPNVACFGMCIWIFEGIVKINVEPV